MVYNELPCATGLRGGLATKAAARYEHEFLGVGYALVDYWGVLGGRCTVGACTVCTLCGDKLLDADFVADEMDAYPVG